MESSKIRMRGARRAAPLGLAERDRQLVCLARRVARGSAASAVIGKGRLVGIGGGDGGEARVWMLDDGRGGDGGSGRMDEGL